MRRLGPLVRQGVLEIIRAKVPTVFLAFLVILAWGSLFLGSLTFESKAAVAVDLGITGTGFFAGILSILVTAEMLGRLVRPAVYPLLAEGTSRSALLLGRWAAAALCIALFSALAPAALLAAFRFLGLRSFNQSDLISAIVLLPQEAVLLSAVATFLLVLLPRAPAVAASFAYWAMAHLHYHPFRYGRIVKGTIGWVIYFAGYLFPDSEMYNPRLHSSFSLHLLFAPFLQTLIYVIVFLFLAHSRYARRDL
ncbi:MAG: hypothetical protein D6679_10925 [Candidatus Hydrogenedentota bacterium]|nr:MAG: hypothetical protein D6679_10925 [Candidatus Hydrogenedentota bacterium]